MKRAVTTITIKDEQETAALAQKLAPQLAAGDVILLNGTLGAGKTAFARALIRALCRDADTVVPSPTFTLVQHYETPDGMAIHHYDLYRLPETEAEDEIIEIGLEESLSDALTLIEWPERLGYLTPKNRVEITLKHGHNENERIAEITSFGQSTNRKWILE